MLTANTWEPGKPDRGDPIRYPLATPLSNRGSSPATDGYLRNCFVEPDAQTGEMWVQKRPGFSSFAVFAGAGTSQGLTYHQNLLFAAADKVLYRITASGAGYETTAAAWASITPTNPWTIRYEYDVVEFNGSLWMCNGYDGTVKYADVWSSDDGKAWTQVIAAAPWTKRSASRLVVFNNELYMIGGVDLAGNQYNDVWKSADGLNWIQLTGAAAFAARSGYGLVAFNNGMFIIGGNTAAGVVNDVWFSVDGITWAQVVAVAAFAARAFMGCCVFNGRIWIYGGVGGVTYDDVYSSGDGKVFTLQNAAATGLARSQAQLVVYRARLFIIGGFTGAYSSQVFISNAGGTVYTLVTAAPGWAAGEFWNRVVVFRLPTSVSSSRQSSMIALGRHDAAGAATGSNEIWYASLNTAVAASFSIPTTVTEDLYFQEQNAGRYLLIKDSQGLYVFDQNTVLQVTDSNYPGLTVDGLAVLDDTAYVMDPSGVIYGSNLSTPWVWNALNYLTAEYEADVGVRIVKYLNYIVAMKANTISFFYDAGSTPGSPLMPIRNATSRVGCAIAKSVVTVSNTIVWVGRTNTMDLNIYMLDGFVCVPIADAYLLRLIKGAGNSNCRAWSCTTKGHTFYVITFYGLGLTYAFDMKYKVWSRWTDTNLSNWKANFYGTDNVDNYVLHDTTGTIYLLSETIYGDAGATIPVGVQTNNIDGGTDLNKFWGRISLIGDRDNGNMSLSWTDDDFLTLSTPRVAATPQSNARVTWVRNGRSRRRAFFLTNITSDKPFRQKALELYVLPGPA